MHHYTYLIQHKTKNLRYIGVRSCKCLPSEDTSYWSSSVHLPKDVQSTHSKIILAIHPTRKAALKHEILLHKLNEVNTNSCYYNKAKQTSVGFDTTGITLTFTEEHKQKISATLKGKPKTTEHRKNCSIAQKRLVNSEGYINPRKGVKLSEETKKKVSNTKKLLGTDKGINNNRFKPWFITYPTYTKLFYNVTKEEQSLSDGFKHGAYQDLCTRSKGTVAIKKGRFKGLIAGNIPAI